MLSLLILYVAIVSPSVLYYGSFTLLYLLMFQTTLHAQPQYRVVVDTPITVLASGATVQPTHVTVCFRERTSVSDYLDYCPLGQLTLTANGGNGPTQTLNLGPGADNLNPEYSSANPMIGLLISVTRNGALLGFRRFSPIDTLLPLGTLANTGFREIIDNVRVNVRLGVECAPGFTGPECNTPVITTTTEGTTTEGDITVGTTTEGDTIGTTTEGTTTVGTTESVSMCTRSTVSSFSIHAPSLGIGLLIGALLATVLTLLVNNMAICWCLRRQRRKAGQRRNKQGY